MRRVCYFYFKMRMTKEDCKSVFINFNKEYRVRDETLCSARKVPMPSSQSVPRVRQKKILFCRIYAAKTPFCEPQSSAQILLY